MQQPKKKMTIGEGVKKGIEMSKEAPNVAQVRKQAWKEPVKKEDNLPAETQKSAHIAEKSNKVAVVKCLDAPVSLKHAKFIFKVINNKSPQKAITFLEEVIKKKIAVPMHAEVPHRKGILLRRGLAGGRYPKNTSEVIIKALKNLVANASVNGMDISRLVVFGRATKGMGATHSGWRRTQFKRTHLFIEAKEK